MIAVIGSGVAGLSAALAAADAGAEVELICAGSPDACSTVLAQGGISAAIGPGDSPRRHLSDTLAAGCGLVDAEAAGVLVHDGTTAMRALLANGFAADRDAHGAVRMGLEAAHSVARVVHAGGDRSGAALHAQLWERVQQAGSSGRLSIRSECSAVSLIERAGMVTGVVLRDSGGTLFARSAAAIVLATGGYAALFPRTSNHASARGDGIVLAARVGAVSADLEFVQFHPTVLSGTGKLISEAVRGAGAVLRDGSGERFMPRFDARAELAPRDVVSRAIHRTLQDRGESQVWLDASSVETNDGRGALARRFPGITAMLAEQGFDWAREPVPVSPAAHYTMGGIVSDLEGRSTVPGLFAAGEVASTGVHGANRLASNSLLEGLVFGGRAGRAAADWVRSGCRRWELAGAGAAELANSAEVETLELVTEAAATPETETVGRALAEGLGIERDGPGLRRAGAVLRGCAGSSAELASMIQRAALARTESRGAHQRADHPATDPAQARRRALRFMRPASESHSDHRTVQGSLTPC